MGKINSKKNQKLIKLLFFSPYFYPYISGITQYPYRFFRENKLSFKTTCLTFKYEAMLASQEKINEGLTIYRMPFLFRISKGFISPSSLLYFWNEVMKTDIVVINLPSFEAIALSLIAKVKKKPIIAFLHCEVHLPLSPFNIIINFVLNCGVILQLLLANKIIVETKDYYEKRWPYTLFQFKMSEVLPLVNTSTPDIAFKKELEIIRNKYTHIIGFCGRVATEKGIEILIESLKDTKDMYLLIAGPTGKDVSGEERYFHEIQNILMEKHIPHTFLGILSEKKLSAFYQSIDLLILPSLNKTEAFGMVQVEAMLQGTPVIASNLPGVRIPIQLTKMGILTTPSKSSEIKNAIKRIINDREAYSNIQLVENAKKIFSSQKTYKHLFKCFTKSPVR